MLELVVDNSDKFYDSILGMYVNDKPTEYPYYLENEDGEMTEMFTTHKDAIHYQMGMGLRATTTIELMDD